MLQFIADSWVFLRLQQLLYIFVREISSPPFNAHHSF